MKVLSSVITTARSAIQAQGRNVGMGMRGLAKGAVFGGTLYLNAARFGTEYGQGSALAYTIATSSIKAGIFTMAGSIAAGVIDKGREHYRQNRRLEMGTPVQDNWGTIQTMRQHSLHRLSRTRSAVLGRTLGNEAAFFSRNR